LPAVKPNGLQSATAACRARDVESRGEKAFSLPLHSNIEQRLRLKALTIVKTKTL